jgi:hypothetical protein
MQIFGNPEFKLSSFAKIMQSLKDILPQKQQEFAEEKFKKPKYITQEFQHYGFRLASILDDVSNLSMYIKLAKITPRAVLESALSFTIDYPKAKTKTGIFLWKVKELKKQYNISSVNLKEIDTQPIQKPKSTDIQMFSKQKLKDITIKKTKKSKKSKDIPDWKNKNSKSVSSNQTTLF